MKSLPIDDVSKQYIKRYHDELNEKERRRNAASLHLAFNCQHLTALCELLEISAKTIRKALSELGHEKLPLVGRQRRKGAGAKSKWNDPGKQQASYSSTMVLKSVKFKNANH